MSAKDVKTNLKEKRNCFLNNIFCAFLLIFFLLLENFANSRASKIGDKVFFFSKVHHPVLFLRSLGKPCLVRGVGRVTQ